ncbi:glutathione S-transferase T3-like protein [Tanacetum coccineum]
MKSKGFWLKVIEYFEKETGSHRGCDSVLSKWKNRFLPRIGAFCVIFDNVQRRNESGSCDLTVYQKACVEYAAEYDHDFSLEPCWQILKEHPAWKQVEMPAFYAKQNSGSKKVKTSETTSDSAQGGLNLNEDAAGSDEEVREVRPMGQDQAMKKKSSTSSRFEASSAAGGGIVDMVADKWKSFKVVCWGKKKEQQQSYIDLKNRELKIQEKANREAAKLKRQELELKRKNLELKLTMKRDKDLRFYMKKIDETLPPIQQEKLMEMKQQIKELYDLDFLFKFLIIIKKTKGMTYDVLLARLYSNNAV